MTEPLRQLRAKLDHQAHLHLTAGDDAAQLMYTTLGIGVQLAIHELERAGKCHTGKSGHSAQDSSSP